MANELGETIKCVRESMSLKQHEFASLCGITPAAVCQIEKGQRTPNIATLKSILSVTGMTFEQLIEVPPKTQICLMCKKDVNR